MTDVHYKGANFVDQYTSNDGRITTVASGDLGNADTSYTYFPLASAKFNAFTLQYKITATTLTYEATDDDYTYADAADEMIAATNNRTFAGVGNWEADETGDTVTVNGGVLEVLGGAKLSQDYFYNAVSLAKGFEHTKKYTLVFTLASTTGGTVSLYAGTQLLASGLTDGAAQSVSFYGTKHLPNIRFVGSSSSVTFSLDNVSAKPQAATWRDVTNIVTDGAATSLTSDGITAVGTALVFSRFRVKRVTTNATNSLQLNLVRTIL